MEASTASSTLKSIAKYCDKHGLRFTEPRKFVAEIIIGSKKPIGAYDILDHLAKKIKNPKPPTVYRALEFLSEHHFIHKIESLDAFIPCHVDHQHTGSQFMICKTCNQVTEIHLCSVPDTLKKRAEQASFNISHWDIEIHGYCKDCGGIIHK